MFVLILVAVAFFLLAGLWIAGLLLQWSTLWLVIASIVIVTAVVAAWLVRKVIAIRRSSRIERELLKQAERHYQQATPEARSAVEELRANFQTNLNALKRSSGGAATLYDLPWYVIIGLPGSGKTTAIRESGLTFPAKGQGGQSVRGIGGTKDCDWWFTDQAIFLDTAGRYTSEAEDRDEWLAFLELIKQARRGKALNGIIVTAAVPDLIQKDKSEIEDHARGIRERLEEIGSSLNLHLPFYVLFTKCDMISGFKSFFAGLPGPDRERFLGHLRTWREATRPPGDEIFRRGVEAMMPWFYRRRVEVLNEHPDDDDIRKAIRFPNQVRTFGAWLEQFLEAVARPNPMQELIHLRGFFLSSSTQPKSPDAPAKPAAEQTGGGDVAPKPPTVVPLDGSIFVAPNVLHQPAASGPTSNAFFLKNVFRRVVIPDHHLVQLSAQAQRRRGLLRLVALYGSAGLGLLLLIVIIINSAGALGQISETEAHLQRMREVETTLASDDEKNLNAIEAVRQHIVGLQETGASRELWHLTTSVYQARLQRLALKPLGSNLSTELTKLFESQHKDRLKSELMYELVKVYQMFAGAIKPDADLMGRKLRENERWLQAFAVPFPNLNADERELARRQLPFLLAHLAVSNQWHIDANQSLIDSVLLDLSEKLWIQQAYDDLIATGGGDNVAQAPVTGRFQHLIQTTAQVPVVFTSDRWEGYIKSSIYEKSRALVERYKGVGQERDPEQLAETLRTFYQADYQRHWLGFMRGAKPAPFRDLRDAANKLYDLTGQQSPYRELVSQFMRSQQLNLSQTTISGGSGAIGEFPWLDEALTSLGEFQKTIADFDRQTEVGQRHEDVRRLQTVADAFDRADRSLSDQQRSVDRDASRDAVFFALKQLLYATHTALSREIAAEIDNRWRSAVAEPFAQNLAGRYPLQENATNEVLLSTFSQFFNPVSGSFWALAGRIDPLREIRFIGLPLLPVSRTYERALARAKQIATALFDEKSATITTPIVLQMQLREAVWDVHMVISGRALRLKRLPTARMAFTWQQAEPLGAKIEIFIRDEKQLKRDEFADSQWGVLRLFRAADLEFIDDGTARATWNFDGKQVGQIGTYQASAVIETPSFNRALADDFFSAFSCPQRVTEEADERP